MSHQTRSLPFSQEINIEQLKFFTPNPPNFFGKQTLSQLTQLIFFESPQPTKSSSFLIIIKID